MADSGPRGGRESAREERNVSGTVHGGQGTLAALTEYQSGCLFIYTDFTEQRQIMSFLSLDMCLIFH